MNVVSAHTTKCLVLAFALVVSCYASIISMELSADVYTLPEDVDHDSSDRMHRQEIMTRTVKCIDGCDNTDGWGTFVRVSGSKEVSLPERPSDSRERNSRQQTVTVGLDRIFGPHLLGVALGTSDGDVNIFRVGSQDHIERDKRSIGMYYGAKLPFLINLSAQFLVSEHEYLAQMNSVNAPADTARYDASGYSSGVALSAIVPLISYGFEYFVEPSASYLYVKTRTDAYTSERGTYFGGTEVTTGELQFALRWRAPFSIGDTYLIPMAGISYTDIGRRFVPETKTENRDQDYFEGILGLTIQRANFNLSASYQETIREDHFQREQYQVTVSVMF